MRGRGGRFTNSQQATKHAATMYRAAANGIGAKNGNAKRTTGYAHAQDNSATITAKTGTGL
ncbi:hypothetical protein AA11825_1867 [Acetobacter pomorum DSM 11825]|nr:hypothetical protein AA11825_1867 [Acetobacter pomorum DSM 11825]